MMTLRESEACPLAQIMFIKNKKNADIYILETLLNQRLHPCSPYTYRIGSLVCNHDYEIIKNKRPVSNKNWIIQLLVVIE